mmetsp:Transcript_17206/g.48384  ORF Transcript_17206/g.48384 Transcript_17206/m.48384 type:complete len:118 (+) Transcript_17206:948-1301(+)
MAPSQATHQRFGGWDDDETGNRKSSVEAELESMLRCMHACIYYTSSTAHQHARLESSATRKERSCFSDPKCAERNLPEFFRLSLPRLNVCQCVRRIRPKLLTRKLRDALQLTSGKRG